MLPFNSDIGLYLEWKTPEEALATVHRLFCGGYYHFLNAVRVHVLYEDRKPISAVSCQDADEKLKDVTSVPTLMIFKVR